MTLTRPVGSGCAECVNRRGFLKTGAAGVTLLALPAGCGVDAVSPPTGPVAAGNVADVAQGTLTVVTGKNVILGRDPGGLYAMSAACTHSGCLLTVVGATGQRTVACACHGSTFTGDGAVTRGPAGAPLPHYRVDVDGTGAITIQGGQPVDAAARTAVG